MHRLLPPQRRSTVLQKGLWASVLALLLVLWALVLSFADNYKQGLIESRTQELVQMNAMVAQHTHALLVSTRTDLQIIDRWLQANPGIDPLNDPRFTDLVNDMRTASDGLMDIRFASDTGQLYYVPSPSHTVQANISDRQYFTIQKDERFQDMYIDTPVIGRGNHRWLIPVSWRLRHPVGNLKIVVAVIDLNRLVAPHELWRIKSTGTIALLRNDGILLSRAPFNAAMLGLDLRNSEAYRRLQSSSSGTYVTTSKYSDGIERIASFENVTGTPLTVVVTRGMDEALASYYLARRWVFGGTLVLTLLVLIAAALIDRTRQSLLNAQQDLHRLALLDELTQTMNRRAFVMQAEREFSRAQRHSESMAVLMLDIDHFKQINDTYGHATGDGVLIQLAETWSQCLRKTDVLGRLGGEEFGVLLPSTSETTAQEIAGRLRRVSETAELAGLTGHVTISVGIAWTMPYDEDWQVLLRRADEALYRAKHGGRNRVELQHVPPPADELATTDH